MNELGKVFKDNKSKTIKQNLGNSVVKKIAQQASNKIAGKQIIGLTDDYTEILLKSKFVTLRKKLEKKLSLYGEAALVSLIVNDASFIDVVDVIDYRIVAGVTEMAVVDNGSVVEVNGSTRQVYIKFEIEGNSIIKSSIYFDEEAEDLKVVSGSKITYKGSAIPVEIFKNNEDGTSDIINGESTLLVEALNWISNQTKPEFERTRMQFSNNVLRGAGKTARQWQSDIDDDQKVVHDQTSPDGEEASALNVLVQNAMESNKTLREIKEELESDILKNTLSWLPSTSTGTNKHNTEMVSLNQDAKEYINSKAEIRAESLNRFFWRVANQNGWSDVVVTLGKTKAEQEIADALQGTNNE